MIDKSKYLTPQQFAEMRGVSNQTIYQQMKKGLKAYVITDNGKKYISIEALEIYKSAPIQSTSNQSQINFQSTSNQVDLPAIIPENEVLKNQIAEKDKQISLLLEQLNTANAQNADLTQLLKREQEINYNNQLIIGRQTQMIEAHTAKQKGFFKRLFGRNKTESETNNETN